MIIAGANVLATGANRGLGAALVEALPAAGPPQGLELASG